MEQFVSAAQQVIAQIPAAELVLFTGVLTAGIHGLIKKHKELSKAVNIFISLVLPLVGAILGALMASASVLAAYPKIYAAAQISYYVYNGVKTAVEWLQLGKAVRVVAPEVTPTQIKEANQPEPTPSPQGAPLGPPPATPATTVPDDF